MKISYLKTLFIFAVFHLLIDCVSAFIVYRINKIYTIHTDDFVLLVVLYNTIAFGTQFIFGFLIDKFKFQLYTTYTSFILGILSLLVLSTNPILPIVSIGLTNSLLHVSSAKFILPHNYSKSSYAGFLIAPGSIGLTLGSIAVKNGLNIVGLLIIILFMSVIAILISRPKYVKHVDVPNFNSSNYVPIIFMIIFITVIIRALIGGVIIFPWKNTNLEILLIGSSVAFGKTFGGVLSDRIGWSKISLFALLLSAPLLSFGNSIPLLSIIGLILFQMTMPVTLMIIVNIFPTKEAFALGVTTLALLAGSLPTFLSIKDYFPSWLIFTIIISTAGLLYFAVNKFQRIYNF